MYKDNPETVLITTSIRNTIKKMDVENKNSLVVINEKDKVCGIFSLGDFRRAVFNGLDINNNLSKVINKEFKYVIDGCSKTEIREIFIRNSLIHDLPVLDKSFHFIKTINRNDILDKEELSLEKYNLKDIPVVVMAGGKGKRLDPFTRVLPKPLIPMNNKPIILEIMNSFNKFKAKDFYISINYKGQMIKGYFHEHKLPYNINYLEEENPLGTAGALKMLKSKIKNTFFVTNCDILIYSHYPSIIEFHKKNNHDLTLITSMRNYAIPYGVCDIDKTGELIKMREKPEFDFLVNTGLYVLEPKLLELIPDNKSFDMSDLIDELNKKKMKVGVFPVSEKSWLDVGQWENFSQILK